MIRLIGDVHGLYYSEIYRRIVSNAEYTIQVGDMGFREMYEYLDKYIDPSKHRFVGGNHDDYDAYYSIPHSLGDYGVSTLNGMNFFFIRGAESIDQGWRRAEMAGGKPKSWWEEEQMTYRQLVIASEVYKAAKPDIVISHTCPQFLKNHLLLRKYYRYDKSNLTRTEAALECMWDEHKPKLWVFGHFHCYFDDVVEGTRFVCLDEHQYLDLPEDLYVAD